MKVTSSAIKNGAFEDKYGKRGKQFSPNGMPTYSIPFDISEVPVGTESLRWYWKIKMRLRLVGLSGFIG